MRKPRVSLGRSCGISQFREAARWASIIGEDDAETVSSREARETDGEMSVAP
jgi:hypothetical protein